MEVRIAQHADAEPIRNIYNVEVAESTVTLDLVPRSAAEQAAWMADHAGAYPATVAVDAGEVVGFASLSPYRIRPAYATTVEDSVYVRRDRRGQGIGSMLLSNLLELATVHGFHAVIARIVEGPQSSLALHRSCGFDLVGVEREVGRKFGRWLDIVIMERLL